MRDTDDIYTPQNLQLWYIVDLKVSRVDDSFMPPLYVTKGKLQVLTATSIISEMPHIHSKYLRPTWRETRRNLLNVDTARADTLIAQGYTQGEGFSARTDSSPTEMTA